MIVDADLEPHNPISFICPMTSYHNHRNIRARANIPQDIQTIVLTELQIEND